MSKVQTQAKPKESPSVTPASGQFQPRLFGSEQQIEAHAATHNATEGDDTLRLGHNFGELDVKAEDLRPKGDGRPLPEPVRLKMENALGADFPDVRVHEGPEAQAIGALAYTQGNRISFAPGEYRPGTTAGQALIGHELVHVVQQRAGRVAATEPGGRINADPGLESEADDHGEWAAEGGAVKSQASHHGTSQSPGGAGAAAPIQMAKNKNKVAPAPIPAPIPAPTPAPTRVLGRIVGAQNEEGRSASLVAASLIAGTPAWPQVLPAAMGAIRDSETSDVVLPAGKGEYYYKGEKITAEKKRQGGHMTREEKEEWAKARGKTERQRRDREEHERYQAFVEKHYDLDENKEPRVAVIGRTWDQQPVHGYTWQGEPVERLKPPRGI